MPGQWTSPSGSFVLVLVEEHEKRDGRSWPYHRLHIYDRSGELLYASPERFAGWFRLKAAWDDQDRVWVASADSGTVVFSKGEDGWTRGVWDPTTRARVMWDAGTGGEVPVIAGRPPEALRELTG